MNFHPPTPPSEILPRFLWGHLAVLCLLFAVFACEARAELIPSERLTDWTPGVRVGVVGGIPTDRTVVFTTINSTGDATDRTATINSALAACPAGQIVLLGPGTFRCDGTLNIGGSDDNITLRGAGIGATVIDCRTNTAISVGSGSDYIWSWPPSGNIVTTGLSKGSTVLTIADTSAFSVGQIVRIAFENQISNAAIAAGLVPTVSTSGYPDLRAQKTRVVSKTSTTLTIAHPIYHEPGAGLAARVTAAQVQTDGVGIEELTIDGGNGTMFSGITFSQTANCWAKNVKSIRTSNYHVYFTDSVNCELRRCVLDGRKTAGSNGAALLFGSSSACLIEDNILTNVFPNIEVNMGSSGNVFAFNILENDPISGVIYFSIDTNHAPHNSYNLYEGNVAPNIIADGYFGSVSEDTIFRNWLHGSCFDSSAFTFAMSLKRFTRNYSVVGNIVGKFGVVGGILSYGQPNIGNGGSTGTAQPTSGDFWNDWKVTATLTTRTSDNTGALTLNSGSVTAAQYLSVRWGTNLAQFYPTAVTGSTVTIGSVYQGSALPAAGTVLTVFTGSGGYQELDLDVEASTISKGNYMYGTGGAPGIMSSLVGDTLPDSKFRTSKPSFFRSLAWPPFAPTAPNAASYDDIPAGYRYVHGIDPPSSGSDTSAPTVPTALAALAAGAAQINLTWTASADNVGVTGYLVERSQGGGSTTFVQVATPAGTAYSDLGLMPATVYNYRVRAVDGAGNLSAYSTVATVSTANSPADTTPPTAPQNLVAVANGATQISLNWSASTDNVGVIGYRVERSQGVGSTTFTEVSPPAGASNSDSGLTPATVYNYRVRAVDAAGNFSGYSSVATATTGNLSDMTAPTVPSNVVTVVSGPTQVNVSWIGSTDNVGVTGYQVERSQGVGSAIYAQVGTTAGVSYGDTGLTAATVYNYRVRAVDASGNLSGYSSMGTATTAATASSNGLVAAYGFDESSGISVIDGSGNDNTGTINGASRTLLGRYGRALRFNGIDNIVLVNSSPSLNLSAAMTLEAWVFPAASENQWGAILHKEADAWYLHSCNPNGDRPPAGGANFNGGEQYVTGPTALSLNGWTHLATTYDGTTLRLYVNGAEVATRPTTGTIEVNANPLRIGGNAYAGQFFAGRIDEIRIYNRALTPSEIQADMNVPVGAPKPPSGLRIGP